SILNLINNNYIVYSDFKDSHKQMKIEDIQDQLDAYTTIIEYFIISKQIYILIISNNDYYFIRNEIKTDISILINEYILSMKFIENVCYKFSYQLYQILIKPIEPYIKNKKNLIIIPDESLLCLPFESILVKEIDSINKSRLKYLIHDYIINYHYSTDLWLDGVQKKSVYLKKDKKKFIGFAPKFGHEHKLYCPNNLERSNNLKVKYNIFKYPVFLEIDSLYYSIKELNQISDILFEDGYSTMILLNDDASESNFIKYCSDFEMIHIASHAFINEENPLNSGILFGDISTSFNQNEKDILEFNNRTDGVLYLNEIFNLDLTTELVVISSCESGLGKLIKGEGIISFSRGFLYAGAKNIIISLWNVNDYTSYKFMKLFYRNYVRLRSYSRAIRITKLELMQDPTCAHPYYWSPFVLIGN
ncbi:CHAT domain-containing protein, partial [candidate division KSB1 bacterium]